MKLKKSEIEELELDFSGSCNLKCWICTRNFKHSQHMVKNYMRPMKDIIAQLDTFTGLKRFFIAGTMSEPTIHPEFLDFIDYLNSRGIYFELFSNAGLHDDSWWMKLGEKVPSNCKMVFTICGSTQELHEKYRVGSNLSDILRRASAFRSNGRHNDYVQHIMFEYNKADYECGNMNKIFDQFSHVILVHSEGRRLFNDKIRTPPDGVCPPKEIEAKINYIFSKQPPLHSHICIDCKADKWKKMYIDQFGNLYPCYTYAENGHPPFDWKDDEYDLTGIYQYSFPSCFLCSKTTERLIDAFNLDFVC